MKALKYTFALGALLFFASCSSMSGNHDCCNPTAKTACAKGQCKPDKSCCKNECKSCTGKKGSCSTGQCATKHK